AMGEHQVTVGRITYKMPKLFLVMATQNPIEQEGTYPLPEAQLDRFLMHVKIGYPDISAEKQILALSRGEAIADQAATPDQEISQEIILAARKQVMQIHMADAVTEYLVQLVLATRSPGNYSEQLGNWLEYGASPRATIALDRCARAHAWLDRRDFVSPDDVHAVAYDCLRHRLILSYEAEADGLNADKVIDELLARVPVA
ncbi:MAG: MoxR family ATPase, partial [Gammaproteobacteria bacterium]|nr:MoxR family ATPase [Gammaproteobacteria bacterium]